MIYSLLGGVLLLLIGVLFSPELNATRRWFFFGGISIQPSELAKLALIPFLAYLSKRRRSGSTRLLPAPGRASSPCS